MGKEMEYGEGKEIEMSLFFYSCRFSLSIDYCPYHNSTESSFQKVILDLAMLLHTHIQFDNSPNYFPNISKLCNKFS